ARGRRRADRRLSRALVLVARCIAADPDARRGDVPALRAAAQEAQRRAARGARARRARRLAAQRQRAVLAEGHRPHGRAAAARLRRASGRIGTLPGRSARLVATSAAVTGPGKRALAVLFAAVLMGALDIAIVGPALPAVRRELGIDAAALSWIFNVYMIFYLLGAPLLARASDRQGRRNVFVQSVALFAGGSLVVALAPSYGVLLGGRAIQAFGAGGLFPVASAVVADTFPAAQRGRALGMLGAVFGLAFLVGPLAAGFVLEWGAWRWLFVVNLPIG